MQTTNCIDAPVEMKLEHFEGQLLCNFIEELIQELAGDQDIDVLEHACEKLGEANAVALWSREHVHLDLTLDETVQLLDALVVRLEEQDWPEEKENVLSEVSEKIIGEIMNTHTSVTVGDRLPDPRAVCVVS